MVSASAVCQSTSTTPPSQFRAAGDATAATHPAAHSRGLGAQTLARGPGWHLVESSGASWTLRLDAGVDEPLAVWSDMLDAVRTVAETHPLRPLLVDMRGAPRLAGLAAEFAAQLFDEFERRSQRLAVVVGPDLVHAARVHRLLDFHAPSLGRCYLTEDEGLDWVARGTWPVAPPSPVVARPWTRSRPHLNILTKS